MNEVVGRPLTIHRISQLSGGCISTSYRLETTNGSLFLKSSNDPQLSFVAEAGQLEILAQSPTTLSIPKPVASIDADHHGPGLLLLPYISPGSPSPHWEEDLGRGLALLHQASSSSFGFRYPTYCGATQLNNQRSSQWIPFFAEQRLRPLLDTLSQRGQLNKAHQQRFASLIDRLGDRLQEPSAPALLHGDLWSGNVITNTGGCPVLIDPAAYYGHPEAEFGMTTLYGGFSERFYAAYQEVNELQPQWEERCAIYRFWHIANHAALFAGSYIHQTINTLEDLA